MSKMTVTKMLLWMVLSLMVACNKDVETISPVTEVQTVHYRASIRTDVDTRATLGEGMVYKYANGDRVMPATSGNTRPVLQASLPMSARFPGIPIRL